ncbi:MAG: calcium/sodium antiporter [Spirulinaceae cyanobacterium]
MSELLLFCLIFVASLLVLVKASDFFTDSAEKIGLYAGLPPFIIGVTIVSIGTSLPELISSIIAVMEGSSEIVVANVVGSNIANVCLIIGVACIVGTKGLRITYDLVSVDLPLFVGSAFLLVLAVWDKTFSLGEAIIFIIAYIMYLFYTVRDTQDSGQEEAVTPRESSGYLLKQACIVILSVVFIYLGAKYTIDSLVKISAIIGIAKEIIAVSAVALGTSLPELVVTINAAKKGQEEVAVGNVLGSNIFNAFMVMGIPRLVGNLEIPNTVLMSGIPTLLAGTLLLFFATQDKKLTIWEGWLFIIIYVWFIGTTFKIL